MNEATGVVFTCNYCRAIIPSQDEVQHHFFIAHGEPVNQSVRCHYPERLADDVEREMARWSS